jgi:hypothetical protein
MCAKLEIKLVMLPLFLLMGLPLLRFVSIPCPE